MRAVVYKRAARIVQKRYARSFCFCAQEIDWQNHVRTAGRAVRADDLKCRVADHLVDRAVHGLPYRVNLKRKRIARVQSRSLCVILADDALRAVAAQKRRALAVRKMQIVCRKLQRLKRIPRAHDRVAAEEHLLRAHLRAERPGRHGGASHIVHARLCQVVKRLRLNVQPRGFRAVSARDAHCHRHGVRKALQRSLVHADIPHVKRHAGRKQRRNAQNQHAPPAAAQLILHLYKHQHISSTKISNIVVIICDLTILYSEFILSQYLIHKMTKTKHEITY